MIAASSGSGGGLVRAAGPVAAELPREILGGAVAGPGEGVDAAALGARHLGDDVRGGAEAVDAERLGRAGHHQAAVPDQPGAEQRRRLGVGVGVGQREGVPGVGAGVLGIAAVAGVAGEARRVAEILPPAPAVRAASAGVAEPGDADALPDRQPLGLGPERDDPPDDLMPGDDAVRHPRQLAVDDVQVGPADAAGGDPHHDLLRSRLGHRPLDRLEPIAPGGQRHRPHGRLSVARRKDAPAVRAPQPPSSPRAAAR